MMTCSIPAATASSTAYWMIGLSTSGSISFGCAFVAGRKRVPQPAAGKTALRTRIEPQELGVWRSGQYSRGVRSGRSERVAAGRRHVPVGCLGGSKRGRVSSLAQAWTHRRAQAWILAILPPRRDEPERARAIAMDESARWALLPARAWLPD